MNKKTIFLFIGLTLSMGLAASSGSSTDTPPNHTNRGVTAENLPLTPGWDNYTVPLDWGRVIYNLSNQGGKLQATFVLEGAKPNHSYTIGAYFFDGPDGAAAFVSGGGAGWKVMDATSLTRDGYTAVVSAADFGYVDTDQNGNGATHVNLRPGAGTYALQFTVRIGTGCTADEGWQECEIVYRTGAPFSVNVEEITIDHINM